MKRFVLAALALAVLTPALPRGAQAGPQRQYHAEHAVRGVRHRRLTPAQRHARMQRYAREHQARQHRHRAHLRAHKHRTR